MHIAFRTIGQQMGIQNIRGILPESIDTFLNIGIIDMVRDMIKSSASHVYNDKSQQKDNHIVPLNNLLNLYTIVNVKSNNSFKVKVSEPDVMAYTSARINYYDAKNIQCRIIDNDNLGSVIADYCNAPNKNYPIITIIRETADCVVASVFNGDVEFDSLDIAFVRNPKQVKLAEDGINSIDCDLPQHLHYEVVKRAVALFKESIR